MNALLIGAGGMGKAWARNLTANHDVTLAGWVDVREGAVDSAVTELGIDLRYRGVDPAAAIDAIHPDFVVDVTPPEVHHDITLCALDRGVPVLGEKPMATSMAKAQAMVAASERAGKLYMVSQSRRYGPSIEAFRNAVRGSLGDLGILNADFYIGAHFGGFRDEMAHVLLLDMAIHTFDEARYISGLDPVSVYAEEFNPSWSWYRHGSSANALFEMEGGCRFTYRGSWCAEGLHSSWEGDWRVVGAKGTGIWIRDNDPYAEIVTKSGGFHSECEPLNIHLPHVPSGIEASLADFVHALRTGETPNGECHDNIKSLAMVFAAIASAERGERVTIAEVMAA